MAYQKHAACYAVLLAMFFTSITCFASDPLSTPDIDDIEYPDDQPHSPEEIHLGKQLFFDDRMSGNNRVACSTCHNPDLGLGDGMRKSLGNHGKALSRHTPPLYNLAWNSVYFWDGRTLSLEEQALEPIINVDEMNLSVDDLLLRLKAVPGYRQQFEMVYGDADITEERVASALAAFMRSIVSDDSPFDRYLAGDTNALSPEAAAGLELFEGKAKCTECHNGPNFTDNSFHSLGIATSDKGRGTVFDEPSMHYRFKTPGLRNVSLTAPYMHDGSIGSLEEVIIFYNEGGGKGPNKDKLMTPLNLTEQEILNLVAFLGSLTDPVEISRPALPLSKIQ